MYLEVGDGGSDNCAQENDEEKSKVERDQETIFLKRDIFLNQNVIRLSNVNKSLWSSLYVYRTLCL